MKTEEDVTQASPLDNTQGKQNIERIILYQKEAELWVENSRFKSIQGCIVSSRPTWTGE